MNVNTEVLRTEQQVEDLISRLVAEQIPVVLDLETTGLNPHTDKIVDIALMQLGGEVVSFIAPNLTTSLSKLKVPLIGQNFKFDLNMLYRAGVDLRQYWHGDTMLNDHLLDENQEHGLGAQVQRRYQDNYKEVFWGKYENYTDAPVDVRLAYNATDVWYTGKIFLDQEKEFKEGKYPPSLLEHVIRLARLLLTTEINGVKLDLDYLQKIGNELLLKIKNAREEMRYGVENQITQIELELWEGELDKRKTPAGKAKVPKPDFNWNSHTQLQKLLYHKLKIPTQFNKKRKPTIDDEALERIQTHHPIIPMLREYRGNQKVYSSFIEATLEQMVGGRIYPSFNVNGTVTGRLSSSRPNLQQLPTEGGVRGIYVPDPGYKFISLDFNQLEVVIAAHFSQDEKLLAVVLEGASQHDITARALGIERPLAKIINFAVLYGAGVSKIKDTLRCTQEQAESQLKVYWETYKGLAAWVKTCHDKVERGEYLETLYGRRRHFPTTFFDKWELERAKRQAANSVIQGTGADITSEAAYLVDAALRKAGIGNVVFTIHDELLIQAKNNTCQEASNMTKMIMEGVGSKMLSVPLKAEAGEPSERWVK